MPYSKATTPTNTTDAARQRVGLSEASDLLVEAAVVVDAAAGAIVTMLRWNVVFGLNVGEHGLVGV